MLRYHGSYNLGIRHRFQDTHSCSSARSEAATGFLAAFTQRTATTRPKPKHSAPAASSQVHRPRHGASRKPQQDPTNTLRGTAARRQRQQTISDAMASSSSAPGREVCPHCQARFHQPEDLVAHFTAEHSDSASGSAAVGATYEVNNSTREVCPQCRAVFSHVSDLVAHVEAAHAHAHSGSRVQTAAASAGGNCFIS